MPTGARKNSVIMAVSARPAMGNADTPNRVPVPYPVVAGGWRKSTSCAMALSAD